MVSFSYRITPCRNGISFQVLVLMLRASVPAHKVRGGRVPGDMQVVASPASGYAESLPCSLHFSAGFPAGRLAEVFPS
jgi:hypothetical protein